MNMVQSVYYQEDSIHQKPLGAMCGSKIICYLGL